MSNGMSRLREGIPARGTTAFEVIEYPWGVGVRGSLPISMLGAVVELVGDPEEAVIVPGVASALCLVIAVARDAQLAEEWAQWADDRARRDSFGEPIQSWWRGTRAGLSSRALLLHLVDPEKWGSFVALASDQGVRRDALPADVSDFMRCHFMLRATGLLTEISKVENTPGWRELVPALINEAPAEEEVVELVKRAQADKAGSVG